MISTKPRIRYIQDQYTAFHDAEMKNYSEQINVRPYDCSSFFKIRTLCNKYQTLCIISAMKYQFDL